MSITVNDNFQNNSPKSLDNKYTKFVSGAATPYASVAEANSLIPSAYRSLGLTVLINDGGNVEYWYKSGITDGDLVVKTLTLNQGSNVTLTTEPNQSITIGATGNITNGGNSFTAPVIIGSNDSQPLSFETGGVTRTTLDASGNFYYTPSTTEVFVIGAGSTSNAEKFQVVGTARANTFFAKAAGASTSVFPLEIQVNSSTSPAFRVGETGIINWGGNTSNSLTTSLLRFSGSSVTIGGTSTTAQNNVTISPSAGWTYTSGEGNIVVTAGTFTASSGTGTFRSVTAAPTLNQTSTASGDIVGFNYIPNVTSVVGDHKSYRANAGRAEFAGFGTGYTAKTANYTTTNNDNIINCDATSAAFTITLQSAVGKAGLQYTVKKIDVSDNIVTVATTSSQTIDGITTYLLAVQGESVTVASNGANWIVINNEGNKIHTYYVSPAGSDSNNGITPNTPFQTISKVNGLNLKPGDRVLFEGGKEFTGTLTTKGGASGSHIYYGSYNGARATIVGDGVHGITIINKSYVTIENLIIVGRNQTNDLDGIRLWNTGATAHNTDIILRNLIVGDFVGTGISGWCDVNSFKINNILIEDCEVYNCMDGIYLFTNGTPAPISFESPRVIRCITRNNPGKSSYTLSHSGNGIIIGGSNNALIEYCESFGNGEANGWTSGGPFGIWMHDSTNGIIRFCESHHNRTGTGTAMNDGGGFDIDGGSSNCVIEYCYSHNNAGAGLSLFEYGATSRAFTNNKIRYCISANDGTSGSGAVEFWTMDTDSSNNGFYNNLIYVNGANAMEGDPFAVSFLSPTEAWVNLRIFNNIWVIDGANVDMLSGTVQGTWDNNLFHARNSANLNYSTGGTTADPLLRDYPSIAPTVGVWAHKTLRGHLEQFKIKATSPALNAGTTVGGFATPDRDFWGNINPVSTVNIGPHETRV